MKSSPISEKSLDGRKHSEFAKFSFLVALGSALMVATYTVAIIFDLSGPPVAFPGLQSVGVVLLWANLVGWGIGVGLAIAGLLQKNRRRIFSVCALILSAAVAVVAVCDYLHVMEALAAIAIIASVGM